MSHLALLRVLGLSAEDEVLHDIERYSAPVTAESSSLAVLAGTEALSRPALLNRSRTLAATFRRLVPPDGRVGLLDTHDPDTIVNILAAFLAQRSVAMLGAAPLSEAAHALAAESRCHVIACGPNLVEIAPTPSTLTSTEYGLDPEDSPEAVLLFTSGTTGTPRGVRLSAANLLANLTAVSAAVTPWTAGDRLGQMLTVTHSFGLSMLLMALARRTPIVFLPPDAGRPLVQALADHGITAFACVPYTLRLLARRRLALGTDTAPTLRHLYLAGGGITEDEIGELLGSFSGDLFCMYGFTEATARAAVRWHGHDPAPAGSVGLPLPGTCVTIVDDEGRPLPPRREGRVQVHSPSLMIGYLGEDVRPACDPITTNDLGVLDPGGHLTITGRDVEMMNFRGNRVSVVGLEAQAIQIDGILAARAVPDTATEDAPCTLHVVLAHDADLAAVRRDVVRHLTPRGIIKGIQTVNEVPTTRSGKLLRQPVSESGGG